MMFLRDQQKLITEKTNLELSTEKHGTGMALVLIKQNLEAGLTHSHGLMKEKVMREFSKETSRKLVPQKMKSDLL